MHECCSWNIYFPNSEKKKGNEVLKIICFISFTSAGFSHTPTGMCLVKVVLGFPIKDRMKYKQMYVTTSDQML